MNFEKLKEKAFNAGISEIEIYTSAVQQISITTFNQEIDSNVVANTTGMAIRGVYNNQIVMVYTENSDDNAIDNVISSIIDNASLITKDEPYFIYSGSDEYQVLPEFEYDYDEYTLDDKVNLCLELDKKAKALNEAVDKTQCYYSEVYHECTIQNNNGLDVKKTYKYAYVGLSVVCKNEKEVKTGYKVNIFKKMADLNLDEIVEQVVEKAVKQFNADTIESKKYPVVFENTTFSNLFNAFISSFSADSVIKNLSFLKDKLNEKVFGNNLTLVDDPFDLRAKFQSNFDDEGVATFKKVLVENGVLKTYLHNLKTAKMMNTTSTANANKAGVTSAVGIRPINLSIVCGEKSIDEVVGEIKSGVYLTSLAGLHSGVNTLNGDFSLQCSGFEIVDGKIDKPVTLIIVSGNIFDVLNNIVEIANDFSFEGPIGTGSVYIKELSISGK